MIYMENDALMDEIQDRDLLKQYRPAELVEALWMQGNVERCPLDAGKRGTV